MHATGSASHVSVARYDDDYPLLYGEPARYPMPVRQPLPVESNKPRLACLTSCRSCGRCKR
jgi:hypothetical protein